MLFNRVFSAAFVFFSLFHAGGFAEKEAGALIQWEKQLSHRCDDLLIAAGQEHISDIKSNIYNRDKILNLFFTYCKNYPGFIDQQLVSWVRDLNIEWFLKEKMVLFYNEHSKKCSQKMTDYLLDFFYSNSDWHIRNSLIWLLTGVKPKSLNRLLNPYVEVETDRARGFKK